MIRDYILNEGLSNNYGDSELRNDDLIGTYNLTNKNVLYNRMARERMVDYGDVMGYALYNKFYMIVMDMTKDKANKIMLISYGN
jgi:hypothetical protein